MKVSKHAKCNHSRKFDHYMYVSRGVLNFELGMDVRPDVSTITL